MSFTTGAALLDAVVLAVVSREEEGTYGYKITQEIKQALELSTDTVPGAAAAAKDGCLTIYDEPFNSAATASALQNYPAGAAAAGRLQGRVESLRRQH